MIRPLYIKLRNFCSFGNKLTHIDFPDPGKSMLIMGPIGSGKSSILHALAYNVTGKKIGGETLVNNINKKGMYTEVAWDIPGTKEPLIIKRGMKPALFEVTGLQGTIQKEMAPELEKKLHITDPQVLLNLCLLSAAKSLPFFSLKKQERLSFLRNFVDTARLDSLAEEAKNINLKVNKSKNILEGETTTIRSQLNSIDIKIRNRQTIDPSSVECLDEVNRTVLEDQLHDANHLIGLIRLDYEAAHGTVDSNKLDKTTDGLDYLSNTDRILLEQKVADQLKDIKSVDEDLSKINSIRIDIEGQIRSANKAIQAAKGDMEGIDSVSCKNYFKELISNYEKDRDQLEVDLTTIKKHTEPILEVLYEKNTEYDNDKTLLAGNKIQIQQVLNKSLDILKGLDDCIIEDDTNRRKVEQIENEKKANADLLQLQEETTALLSKKDLDLAEATRLMLVSKEYRSILDNTWGYMANRMVPFLNSKIPHYMSELDLDFYMQLDPRDISKPVFGGRPGAGDLKLGDLSTGQKRALSFCLAHSLRDLEATTHGVDIGFLAIDEMAGNFDSDTVELMIEFEYNYMTRHNTSLILITHDVALQQRSDWDSVLMVSRNNFTEVELLEG